MQRLVPRMLGESANCDQLLLLELTAAAGVNVMVSDRDIKGRNRK